MIDLLFALACGMLPQSAVAQELPRTVAEASHFERTSTHAEVLELLRELKEAGAPIRIETIGESTLGRPLPLVILADPPLAGDAVPDPATRERVAVCVQANIHGGEVDGKEAILILLRDIALGGRRDLLSGLILLAIPDFNPDGNDRLGPSERNRRSQPGPALVGRRHNGQDLDLNRDYMKARSPEVRALLARVWNRWDPDVFVDLHTTDGSAHGYPLLYAPPLHPGGPAGPREYARDIFLPEVCRAMRVRHGYEIFDYGNFDSQERPTRWSTYDYKARMSWTYAGMRGRIGILSESFAYATFRTRVEATYHFVEEILRAASSRADEIRRLVHETDAGVPPPTVALRGTLARRPRDAMILVEETAGSRPRIRLGLLQGKLLAVYDRFAPAREVPLPAGYLLPPRMAAAVEHLRLHGIRVETLEAPWEGEVEIWTPTSIEVRAGGFEGGRFLLVDARRSLERRSVPEGSFVVPTAQPLGLLAVHLLEPEAPDGIVAWGIAGVEPKVGRPLPYFRLPSALPGGASRR